MGKNPNSGKVKLVLFIAIAVVVLLVVISVVQIIDIHIKKAKIYDQQNTINNLYEQHEYYESEKDSNRRINDYKYNWKTLQREGSC